MSCEKVSFGIYGLIRLKLTSAMLYEPPHEKTCRTSTIVQFIFYFWSFEINVNILRNQK